MRKVLLNNWPFLIILALSISIAWPIFLPGYFSHHDDLQVMRIFEMRKCLEDLQIPCRWVPDMGFGNGYPLFNYYNVFPYYLGAIASYFLGFIGSAKLLFFIATSLAGVSMYLLAQELFGRYPALLASTLYIFAPYRALDIYVRGAVAEGFSIAIIPLIFYFALKVLKENTKLQFKIGLTLSFAALLTSHNILTMLFLPVIFILLLIWFWGSNISKVLELIYSLLLGFGLSAFYVIPAFLERNLVQIENLVRLEADFRGHFATLYQLFLDRSWGYGASFPGVGDTISFQIGWPHYFLVIASILIFPWINRKSQRIKILYLVLVFIFISALFMTHIRSAFIWEKIGILRFTQFPWRFLSIVIFSSGLLGGFFISNLRESFIKPITVLLILATVILNWNYFRPQEFFPNLTDKEKLSGKFWETQQRAAILDYLPAQGVEPLEAAPDNPIIVEGDAKIWDFKNRSNNWKFEVDVAKETKIEVPVFDFPSWQVFVNGQKIDHSNKNYLGRIIFRLESGQYSVVGKFNDTLIRILSNAISFVSVLVIVYLLLYGKNRKVYN